MNQNFNDYESIGKRPPIPGEETKKFKVTFAQIFKKLINKLRFNKITLKIR